MAAKRNALGSVAAHRDAWDLVWRPVRRGRADRAFASNFIAEGDALSVPMFLRRRLRILIDPAIDLFAGETADASLDLVHAVIAVSYWHSFVLVSNSVERMRRYYADPETPRRIAEEIDLLSLSAIESASSHLSPRLVGGFARVRYGVPPSGGALIGPLSPEPWPLANLTRRAAGQFPLVSEARPVRG